VRRLHQPKSRISFLLRARRERPSRRRAAEKGDEFPPPHGADPKAKDHGTKYSRCWGGSVARIKSGALRGARWATGRGCRPRAYVRFAPKATEVLHCRELMAVPSVADCQASPVGTIVVVSIIRMTAFSGARVRWITPFGTTKPCCGESATERPSRS